MQKLLNLIGIETFVFSMFDKDMPFQLWPDFIVSSFIVEQFNPFVSHFMALPEAKTLTYAAKGCEWPLSELILQVNEQAMSEVREEPFEGFSDSVTAYIPAVIAALKPHGIVVKTKLRFVQGAFGFYVGLWQHE
jgi:hypothetical protein